MWKWTKRLLWRVAALSLIGGGTLSWLYSEVISSLPTTDKVIALTYDDGPHPVDTDELLTLLAEKDVAVTFFLKGRNVEAFPDVVEKIHVEGHEIGNHSFSHRPMWSLDRAAMREQIERTNNAIFAASVLDAATPGGLIVLHDGHADVDGPASQETRAHTIAATAIIIDTLRSQGYRFMTAGQIIKAYGEIHTP